MSSRLSSGQLKRKKKIRKIIEYDADCTISAHNWFNNAHIAEVEFYRTFHVICIALSRSDELRRNISSSTPPTREVRLLLGMDSWSGLGKIINT